MMLDSREMVCSHTSKELFIHVHCDICIKWQVLLRRYSMARETQTLHWVKWHQEASWCSLCRL